MADCRPCRLAAVAVVALVASASASALTLTTSSGPMIKTEMFRGGNSSGEGSWGELAFNFTIPEDAVADGEFHLFAGGDLNNIGLDWIDVTEGPFGDRTLLGTFAFPIGDVHFTACENAPHANISPCPTPETVPGGMFADARMTPVGDVQGRRNTTMFNAGTPGLIVPQEMLVAGANLQISLFPRNSIYDLYIDRMELRFDTAAAIPEPATVLLTALGLAALACRQALRPRSK